MYSRSIFLKLDKLNITTLSDAIMMREYLESFICYITKKIMIDASYPVMDIRYDYSSTKIDHAFNTVEHLAVLPNLRTALLSLNHILTRNIEEVIQEFYMGNYCTTGCLNINSILVNRDTLLITFEFFNK